MNPILQIKSHAWFRTALLACGLSLAFPASADHDIRAFDSQTLDQIRAQYQDEPFLLALWSLHCAPCYAELQMIGELLQENPDLPVVLVSTDNEESQQDLAWVLEDYGLEQLGSWQVAQGLPAALRHSLDPSWHGELPRSYFFDSAHQRQAHSGRLTEETLRSWLDAHHSN